MKDFHKDYYQGINGIYFYRILNKLISIGNLDKRDIKILDFGCGTGKLKKKLGEKVINYDCLPDLSEIKDWKKAKFDVMVANEVFYLFNENQLKSLLSELYKVNPKVELIVGISRQGFLNKMAAFLAGEKDAHADTKLSPEEQLRILKEKTSPIRKKSVFFMCDVFLLKFK